MTPADITNLRRLIDEAKSGFPVDRDPWSLCEELLDRVELLEAVADAACTFDDQLHSLRASLACL